MNLSRFAKHAPIAIPVAISVVAASAYYAGRSGRRRKAKPARGTPDVSHLVRPEVFAAFPAWVQQFEGAVPHMYQDIKGYVTTGIGNLIDPINLALELPWRRANGSLATDDEIRDEWERVKDMDKGMLASKYATAKSLRLAPEDIAQLVRRHSANDILALVKAFPDFPSYPAQVQTAIMGMAWALGAYFPAKWPSFSAAVRARDWKTAAEQSHSRDFNPDRNEAHRELFLQAAVA